ncbi:MAG: IclR family transcriptional regulator, partial [Firmicutes bacterium]|nr:IclR family transcriptional regulator [Bacillota bacterium]
LSQALDLPKSTVHRLVATLCARGFMEQVEGTGNYRLGLRLHGLGARTVVARTLTSEAEPFLKSLLEKHGETVSISVLDGHEAVIVDKMESPQAMRVTSQIGKRNPVHCSASGKVLLAFAPPEAREKILSQISLERYTDKTITCPEALRGHLDEVRRQGYAVDDEEIQEDQVCLSAPVWDHEGCVCAAITISGPAGRIRGKGLGAIAASIVAAAWELSGKLGAPIKGREKGGGLKNERVP